jgi:probable HAF family extracellular repeat protein
VSNTCRIVSFHRTVIAVLACAVIGACSESATESGPRIATLEISGLLNSTLVVGDTVTLTCVAFDGSGNEVDDVAVTWSSSNTDLVRVTASGFVTAWGIGESTKVTARVGDKAVDVTLYVMPKLIVFPTANVELYSINISGEAAATWDNRPARMSPDGSFTKLDPYYSSFTTIGATAIDDSGHVVGCTTALGSSCRAGRWTGTTFEPFVSPYENAESIAYATSNTGIVVGHDKDAAFSWTTATGMKSILHEANFFGVNDAGDAAGYFAPTAGTIHAILWRASDDQLVDLLSLGGDFSRAWDVNSKRQVVGESNLDANRTHAFLWSEEDGMIDIGLATYANSYAYAINEAVEVVGWMRDGPTPTHAFLWTKRYGVVDIGAVRTGESFAFSINDNGVVAGSVTDSGTHYGAIWITRKLPD